MTGRIHSIDSFGTMDGPGVRFVVFFQGCPLRCLYCHNPDTWNPNAGTLISAEEIVEKAERFRSYLRGGGVTLSGGEPLLQPEFSLAILQHLRKFNLHSALDTAGMMPLSISAPVIDAADMVLLDIKALDPEDCRVLTGQSNANELSTLDYCEKTSKRTWIRHVIVPGITLDTGKLKKLAAFLRQYTCVEKVELLPFHKLGEYKWKELGIPYTLSETPEPTLKEIEDANRLFVQQF